MPHLILEYSGNIPASAVGPKLLQEMQMLLAEFESFKIEEMKSRAVRQEIFCVAGGTSAFVHLQLALLPGRSPDLKRAVSERLLKFLRQAFSPALEIECAFSVELRELEKESYSKARAELKREGQRP